MSRRALASAVLLSVVTLSAGAEPLKFSGSVRFRAEQWGWFETPGYDDSYVFFGSLIRASASQQRDRFDWQAEIAQPSLLSLPDRAIAPGAQGQLGFGGTYYAANGGDENAASIFVKQAAVRFKWPGHSLRVGRFEFIDGTEAAPKNPALAAVKSARVAHRLVGNFGFSHVGRSFDGVQYVYTRPALTFSALAVKPTVGAFDVSGMEEIEDVTLLYGSVTHAAARSDARLFLIGYGDKRAAVKAMGLASASTSLVSGKATPQMRQVAQSARMAWRRVTRRRPAGRRVHPSGSDRCGTPAPPRPAPGFPAPRPCPRAGPPPVPCR